jgi:hypothetical protein
MRKRQIIGAWLSLFATLMIFAGPLISRGIGLSHGKSQPMSMVGIECHDMLGTSQISHPASAGKNHDLVVWEKCGYCFFCFSIPLSPSQTCPGFNLMFLRYSFFLLT